MIELYPVRNASRQTRHQAGQPSIYRLAWYILMIAAGPAGIIFAQDSAIVVDEDEIVGIEKPVIDVDDRQASPPQPKAPDKEPGPNLYPIEDIPLSDTVKAPVLDFKNTDIRDILRALGMQYGVNIYLEPDVQGKISLYLMDVPVKSAIDFICKRSKFAYKIDNGIVKVYKYEEPAPPPPPEPPVVFHYENGVLDIDIKDLTPHKLARLFSDSTQTNVVVEGQASKKITSRLTNLSPAKAIKVLYQSNGFDVSASDGVYYVSEQEWGGKDDGHSSTRRLKRLSITVSNDKIVTMEVDDASLDLAIRTIAVQSGINVIIYDKITGTITAKFSNQPIDHVFRFLLQNTKFTFWKDRDIYFIGSREMSEQKTTLVIGLKHIMADEGEFSKMLPPHISKSAVIKYDKEHNAIIIIGSFDVIAQAQEYIEKLDKPIPQVLIEALVVDFNINKIREFGISVFTQGKSDSSGNWDSESFLPELALKPGRQNTLRALKEVMQFLGINEVVKLPKNFRSTIRALETADVIKVHSTPQIATINGNAASITIGETRYYKLSKETRTATGTEDNIIGTDERFERIELNTRLEVTPWVMDEGYVMVKIRPEFKIPRTGGDLDRPPTTDTRILESMVRLKNGETIVLGGQRQTADVVNRAGIPFLSAIPLLGTLFSHKIVSKNETQMMIFLTPHVYYGDEGKVTPNDFVGTEIKRILEKNDPDRYRKRLEKRREKRKKRRDEREKRRKVKSLQQDEQDEKKKLKFRWPWKRKKVKEETESKPGESEGGL
ncbi:MAG: hypothetical protein GF398_18335 [Chitinivibrionales bacterium]|nr:hypothetical protein [Chitinivibrionales bacterium]